MVWRTYFPNLVKISNDHRTKKEIDHIITRDRNAFTSCRVYRGAECPANTDHRLLAAKMKLSWRPAVRSHQHQPKYDTISLLNDSSIADRYTVDVCNRFQALSSDEDDVESQWAAIRSAIRKSANTVVGRRKPVRKPWLSDGAFDIIQQKLTARKQGDHKERNRLKRLFDKTAKADREQFFNRVADDAEAGMLQNDLRAAYRAINVLGGRTQAQHSGVPINDASGAPCKSEEDTLQRWAKHYEQALNHSPGSPCYELDDLASNTSPDPDISDDAPSKLNNVNCLSKVCLSCTHTIYKLSNFA